MAQTTAEQSATRKRDAADIRTASTTHYRSMFDGYVASNEDKPVAWRDANALVGSIGGWRVYAKESQQPSQPMNPVAPAAASRHPTAHEKQ